MGTSVVVHFFILCKQLNKALDLNIVEIRRFIWLLQICLQTMAIRPMHRLGSVLKCSVPTGCCSSHEGPAGWCARLRCAVAHGWHDQAWSVQTHWYRQALGTRWGQGPPQLQSVVLVGATCLAYPAWLTYIFICSVYRISLKEIKKPISVTNYIKRNYHIT